MLPADYENDASLALWFTPQAIREHYEGDDDDPTAGMTDDELAKAGHQALLDDGLYRAFHAALEGALGRDDGDVPLYMRRQT